MHIWIIKEKWKEKKKEVELLQSWACTTLLLILPHQIVSECGVPVTNNIKVSILTHLP
jgi:hypothetical protein